MPKAKHSPGSVLCYTAGRSASSSRVLCPLLPATLMNLVPKVHISAPVANASPWPTSFRGSAGPLGAELTPEDILMWILTLAANNYSTETWQGPFPGPALDSHCVCSSLTLLPGWMRREGLAMRAGQRCSVCGLHSSDSILVRWGWLLAALPLPSDSGAGQNWKKKHHLGHVGCSWQGRGCQCTWLGE